MSESVKYLNTIYEIFVRNFSLEIVFDKDDKKRISLLEKYKENNILEVFCYIIALQKTKMKFIGSLPIFQEVRYLVCKYKLSLKNV